MVASYHGKIMRQWAQTCKRPPQLSYIGAGCKDWKKHKTTASDKVILCLSCVFFVSLCNYFCPFVVILCLSVFLPSLWSFHVFFCVSLFTCFFQFILCFLDVFISLDKWKLSPCVGAGGKVSGSPESLGFLLIKSYWISAISEKYYVVIIGILSSGKGA